MMKFISRIEARNAQPRSERPIVIACIGDSVTHGCFELVVSQKENTYQPVYQPDEGYVARLSRHINRLFPAAAVTLLNAGISGDSSRGGLQRLQRDVLNFSPDLVVVNFGLNDSMNKDTEAGIAAYESNMRRIFQKILESGAEAMLVTPNFMCSYVSCAVEGDGLRATAQRAAEVQNGGILKRYTEAARIVAREMNVPIADTYRRWEQLHDAGVDTTMLLSNGINHPTKEMHDLFVEEILRTAFEG